MSIDVLAAALRAASFIAVFQATGAALFLSLLGRHLAASARWTLRLCFHSGVVALALVAAQYAVEAGRLGGDVASVADAGLQGIVMRSPLAFAASLKVAGLALITLASCRSFHKPIALAGLLATFAAFAMVGHSATHSLAAWLRPALLLHVAVAAFWFGGLLPLVMAIRMEQPSASSRIVDRYSALAIWFVPALFLAGALLLAVLTRLDPQTLNLPYGRILAFKVLAFAVLMAFAALNRYRLAPRLADGRGIAAGSLIASICSEIALLATVLAATAVLTTLYSPSSHDASRVIDSGPWSLV